MNSLKSLALIASCLMGLLVRAQVNDKQCISCASPSLKSRWQITGLPRIAEQAFRACDLPEGGEMPPSEPCSSSCFTYMFDDPDTVQGSGTTGSGQPLVVRGCHSTIAQVVSDRMSSSSSYCELDTDHRVYNSRGSAVYVRALVEFCGAANCNNRKGNVDNYNNPACNQQTVNNLLNNQPLNCFECTAREGKNCAEDKCSKKYCAKEIAVMDGGFQLTKSCSNINLLGLDNKCMTYDVITTPGGIPVKNRYTQCYCKDKQYCNGAVTVSALLSTVVPLIGYWLMK